MYAFVPKEPDGEKKPAHERALVVVGRERVRLYTPDRPIVSAPVDVLRRVEPINPFDTTFAKDKKFSTVPVFTVNGEMSVYLDLHISVGTIGITLVELRDT